MENAKTILLWGQNDLLSSAVEYLLKVNKKWEVISISNTNNIKELITQVKDIKPDLIIINQDESVQYAQTLVHAFEEIPEIKIVTINFIDNSMEVFSRQTGRISETADFLSFIEQEC